MIINKLCTFLKKDKFLFYSYLLTFSFILGAICNLLFQYFNIKFLSKESYSILSAFLSLQYVFAFSFGSLRIYFLYLSSKNEEDISKVKAILENGIKMLVYPALLSLILLVILSTRLVHDYLVIALFSISTLISIFLPVLVGILNGLKRYVSLFITNSIPFILKLIIAILLFLIGLGLLSPFVALAVSSIFGVLLVLYFLRDVITYSSTKVDYSIKQKEMFMFVVFILSLSAMISFDIYIARLNGISYDFYANATFGKFVFYLAGPFMSVALPYIIGNGKRHEENKLYFRRVIKNILALSSLAIVSAILFKDFIKNILYSNKYSADLLPLMFVIYLLFSLGYVIWIYLFVTSKKREYCFVIGTISAIFLLSLFMFGKSLFTFLMTLITNYSVLLLSGLFEYYRQKTSCRE